MVYARTVKDKTVTLCVSGQLWNSSLVMMDVETKSLWSHILGECMQGDLKGAVLKALPCDMVTWKAWREAHPKTTVLNLSRTSKNYGKEFYREPQRFVVGFLADGGPQHCTMAVLREQPLLNLKLGRDLLLLTYDPESTSARLFSRVLDGRELTFAATETGKVRDEATGSVWDRASGTALEGPLKGKQLEARVGIVSTTRAWQTFHPESKAVTGPARPR